MIKNILIPTDFSRNAHEALFYAIELFKNKPCNFFILHTFEVKNSIITSRLNTDKGRINYQQKLKDVNDKLDEILLSVTSISEGQKHTFETITITKPLIETIHKTIDKKDIDLVIMGTKGASGIKEILFGSNTVKLMKSTFKVPLLMVPIKSEKFSLKNIAFASTHNIEHSKFTLTTINSFCNLKENTNFETLQIKSTDEELSDTQLENQIQFEQNIAIDETNYSVTCIDKKKSIEKHISNYTEEFNFDLLIMIKYMHDDYYKLMHEAIIKKLGYHIKIPFLIIPHIQ